jgi:hypothetical protein
VCDDDDDDDDVIDILKKRKARYQTQKAVRWFFFLVRRDVSGLFRLSFFFGEKKTNKKPLIIIICVCVCVCVCASLRSTPKGIPTFGYPERMTTPIEATTRVAPYRLRLEGIESADTVDEACAAALQCALVDPNARFGAELAEMRAQMATQNRTHTAALADAYERLASADATIDALETKVRALRARLGETTSARVRDDQIAARQNKIIRHHRLLLTQHTAHLAWKRR